ncbi:hypothetical protein TWF694_000734 [Orbilia ellipsospora]|uniref:Secreted protein n=1 Tax=Orbilia ellipsospora TaxID=2528407 RepID=A0AAV9XQC8_9PEZI
MFLLRTALLLLLFTQEISSKALTPKLSNTKDVITSPTRTFVVAKAAESNQKKQLRKRIDPDIFYEVFIECPSFDQILQMDDDPTHYPVFEGGPRRRPTFRHRPPDRSIRNNWGRRSVRCRNCLCDRETGAMIPNPVRRHYAIVDGSCTNQGVANRCMAWYGCHCVWNLLQPPQATDISVVDYQDALNKIPKVIKDTNPNWRWNSIGPDGPSLMKWQSSAAGGQAQSDLIYSDHRRLAPGTKEPYYVEGPSGAETWDWSSSPLLRAGFAYGSWLGQKAGQRYNLGRVKSNSKRSTEVDDTKDATNPRENSKSSK